MLKHRSNYQILLSCFRNRALSYIFVLYIDIQLIQASGTLSSSNKIKRADDCNPLQLEHSKHNQNHLHLSRAGRQIPDELPQNRAQFQPTNLATIEDLDPSHRYAERPLELHENANNRSIYSSLKKIIQQLRNQLERNNKISNRLDSLRESLRELEEPKLNSKVSQAAKQPSAQAINQINRSINNFTTSGTTNRNLVGKLNDTNEALITVDIFNDNTPQQDLNGKKSSEAPALVKEVDSNFETKLSPYIEQNPFARESIFFASKRLRSKDSTKLSKYRREQTNAPRFVQRKRTTPRSLKLYDNGSEQMDTVVGEERPINIVSTPSSLLNEVVTIDDVRSGTQDALVSSWSKPMPFIPITKTIALDVQNRRSRSVPKVLNTQHDDEMNDRVAMASNSDYTNQQIYRPRHSKTGPPIIEATPVRVGEDFGSNSDLSEQQQRDQMTYDEDRTATLSNQINKDQPSTIRQAQLSPQGIRLQQVYPQASNTLANSPNNNIQELIQYTPRYSAERGGNPNSFVNGPIITNTNPAASLYSPSNYQLQQTIPQSAQTQLQTHQFHPHTNRDLLNQPQTIQITAVPNNNLFGANGLLGTVGGNNQLFRVNTIPGQYSPWNNWNNGYLDPFNRQVMMVSADRRQIDWNFWIWPIVAVVTLPLILGALFVPVFLKTIVTLIQILQSLGLLLPIASALGQQISHATGVSAATAAGAIASSNQVEHNQKVDLVT